MLTHWEITLEADPTRYIPFRGDYPGAVRGRHVLRYGTERDQSHAVRWALEVFPLAKVVEVWETTILGRRLQQMPVTK